MRLSAQPKIVKRRSSALSAASPASFWTAGIVSSLAWLIDVYNNVVSGMSFAAFCMCGDPTGNDNPGAQTNIRVFQNTFVGRANQHVVRINDEGNVGQLTGFDFESNIVCTLASSEGDLFYIDPSVSWASFTIDYNLYYAGGATVNGALGNHTSQADPEFKNTPANSVYVGNQFITVAYDIDNTSPAKDYGGTEYTAASYDIRNNERDSGDWDLGAFEHP